MKVKRLLRFYFCAEELNSALDDIIVHKAVGSDMGACTERCADDILKVIEVKGELSALWNYLDGIFCTLGAEDVRRLERYAMMRRSLRSLAEAERKGVHSSLMKFARRNVNFGCRFDGAMKVLGAYYCLIPPRADGVCQSGG